MDKNPVTTPHGYTLVLRYSSLCAAIWAKITNAPDFTIFSVRSNTGQGQEWFKVPYQQTSGYSNMVDDQGTNTAVACADTVCTNPF